VSVIRNWQVVALIVLTALSGSARAQTLYTDSFGGAGTALNGTLVQGGTLQTGSVAWSANSAFLNDGNIDETLEGSAILPFAPVVNQVYTLSMDVLNASANWIGLGFKNAALTGAGTSNTNDRLSNGGGLAWMLYRNNPGNNNSIELFAGPNVTTPIADINNHGSIDFNVANNLKVVINTSGSGNSFTADFQINNSSISNGPQLVSQPLSALQFLGLTYDNTAASAVTFDNFLLTQAAAPSGPNLWQVNGGGTFATAANWSQGTPASGSTVQFGDVLTAPNSPATVTIASPATLGEVQFNNAAASYNLAGPSTLTLNGTARVNVQAGSHEISAVIAGSAGLTKTGTGQVTLSADNTYTGTTNVSAGSLRIRHTGAVDGTVNVDTGASVFFEGNNAGGGFNGTFTPNITGAGEVGLSNLLTTETVTISSAKTYTGVTTINGGTLALSGTGTLGTSDGTPATRTLVDGNQATSKLALSGGIAVANELLILEARELAALNSPHVTSSGANSWSGNVKGEAGGSQYNIESTSGTLTLSGTISALDTATRNFVFSGAGNVNVTGKIVDVVTDVNGGIPVTPVNALNNVSVIKRGSGKLTINTATDVLNDYWRAGTTVEAGTLEVISNGANGGELRSATIAVRSGAVLDIDHFTSYSMQSPQDLSGAGDIHAVAFSAYGDNLVSPGDNGAGTLTFRGAGGAGNANLTIGSDFFDAAGARGGLAYDLASATTVGGGVNDLITGVNNLTLDVTQFTDTFTPLGTDAPIEVMVTPSQNQLAAGGAGTYRLINYSGTLTNVANTSVTFAPQLQGVGAIRQTLAVSTATAGQVNLVVSGSAASLTWNGGVGNDTWNIDTNTNWTGADGKYKDLDSVTFGAAGIKDVVLNTNVAPAVVNFSGGAATTYTLNGSGGIRGGATVNVHSGTVRLRNTANAYSGPTTVAASARLEMGTATTGAMTVNGTLAVPSNINIVNVDSFSDTSLGEYTLSKVLDQGAGTSNISFSSPSGDIRVSSAGTTGAEQVLFLRNDHTLDVGETLVADVIGNGGWDRDIGIAVSIPSPAGLANGAAGDVRLGYAEVSARSNDQIVSFAKDTTNLTSGQEFNNNVYGGVSFNRAQSMQLFVTRVSAGSFEVGWIQNGVRHVVTANGTDFQPYNFATNVPGAAIGFYADVRADLPSSPVGLDNLQITTGTANNALTVNGNLNLAASGVLDLDISAFDSTSVNVTGTANLAGTLSINLLNGFMPEEGNSYDFLNAASIVTTGLTFDLPSLTGGLAWDTSDFSATGILSVIAAGLAGDFDNDGDVDGRDFLVWQRNPAVGDLADWQANYGMTSPLTASSTSVPEPGTVGFAALCLLLGAVRRSRV
jgi:fibronectin-binding autotransporter adhesin